MPPLLLGVNSIFHSFYITLNSFYQLLVIHFTFPV